MIIYHAAYDLASFHGVQIDVFAGGWWLLARASLVLFLAVTGVSAALSSNRDPNTRVLGYSDNRLWKRFLRIGLAALLVTIATYVMDPETFVRFGVLHLIAVSVLLIPLFAPLKWWNVPIAILIFFSAWLLGLSIPSVSPEVFGTSAVFLIPFGFAPANFSTVDYVPMIPWFGVILFGLACGQWWYAKERRGIVPSRTWKNVTWPGRHSLAIYLLHQPILMTIFALLLR